MVTNKRKGTHHKQFIFVGNLPTNATNEDIWRTVKGNTYFTTLFTPNNRDRNNNIYAFLLINKDFSADKMLDELQNIKLFGRILGFAVAKRSPPTNAFGYRPPVVGATSV